ncbi:hypothetical protein LZ32DRAFT_647041 [Colletotrichum eremochloae]|nr:hypothetical protein LZ32DRAFT_647041 [Colletotrichum eremochloae]
MTDKTSGVGGQADFTYPTALDEHHNRLLRTKPFHSGSSSTNPDEAQPLLAIETHVLSRDLTYFALSYNWGTVEYNREKTLETRPVTLNGKAFCVCPNLYDALLQFWESFPRRLLWINVICVNQDDYQEREVQVGVMSAIHAGASMTVA